VAHFQEASIDDAWIRVRLCPLVRFSALRSAHDKALCWAATPSTSFACTRGTGENARTSKRVREVLRSAGFTELLRYKRDIDTAPGVERFTYEA
jgi:hypothetical protein